MTVRSGDSVIFCRSDEKYDLFRIEESGDRVKIRDGLASRQQAYEIARASLSPGGRVWIGDEATPGDLEPY